MIDSKALSKMSYGLYLVSAHSGDQTGGCVVNTVSQVTVSPVQLTVAINKENATTNLVKTSGFFAVTVLSQSATMELIGKFGFQSSKEVDKFAGYKTCTDENGVPYVCEQAVARFSCKVVNCVDLGTHLLFVGEVIAAEILDEQIPMSYAYYHTVKNGKTPPKASVYQEEQAKGYRCKICGYVLNADIVPKDFVCPICGRGPEELEKIVN
ncbi:MAG: flavin reductase [Ruthenibacterium sp.]